MKMPLNLSKIFAPMAVMAMTVFPSMLKSQDMASIDNTPPVTTTTSYNAERTENTKSITTDPKAARMTIKYGDDNDAHAHSKAKQCFVLIVNNGKKSGYTLEQLADIIQTHIVKNSMDVTYFLDDSFARDDATVVTSAYSNGESIYRPNSNADYTFTLTELNDHFETYKKMHQDKSTSTATLDLNK